MGRRILIVLVCCTALVVGSKSFGDGGQAGPSRGKNVIVPDHFLRRWDPVTIFFAQDIGTANGAPEDHPERFVQMTPDHPGAFTWRDARTLQFKPAEPWPPLARFQWQAGGERFTLTTLLSPPVTTIPDNNAERLEPVESITLTFPDPLDMPALARMLTIELRPLPGISRDAARWLTRDNFELKAMERTSSSDQATYVILPDNPIPLGTRAIVHFRLSLDDDSSDSFAEITFATAEPFRVLSLGCYDRRYPVTPEGSRYTPEQAIKCDSYTRTVVAEFSAPLREIGPVEGRNLVRFTPAVENLSLATHGKTLEISANFAWETVYRITLVPGPISDKDGRLLQMKAESEVHLYFPRKPAYLKWGAGEGIIERFGPQMVPLKGRAQERVDLRIYPIDSLDRSFWPFPDHPVVVDESQRPPGPGEEPDPYTDAASNVLEQELIRQLSNLSSPPVSKIVSLPLKKEGGSATFGLDLQSYLALLAGRQTPGTYLVGIRLLDTSSQRSWMRIQVTDLSLSTLEESHAVRFYVTSLSTSQPVSGAMIRLEGREKEIGEPVKWATLMEGITDAQGSFKWNAPGPDHRKSRQIARIVVKKGKDTLVLDPTRAPELYEDNQWFPSQETWLQWAFEDFGDRGPGPEFLCHIFTERPVYRPDEEVHIKGYLRRRELGALSFFSPDGFVVVDGPGGLQWRYPAQLSANGSFYHTFAEKSVPTGEYSAHFEDKVRARYGQVSFRIEAYRIPEFEVQIHSSDRVSLDREFEVSLTATYYAGGRVAGRPVSWRITQFPYTWMPKAPKGMEGFFFSSDARFSSSGKFESTPRLEKEDTTGEEGSASILLNPAIEPTAQPRSYVVEATVTGADDQTVTSTKRIAALPPFVLGLKVPRYLDHANTIEGEMIVIGPDERLLEGVEVTVRLLRRQWHSILRAGDFTEGVARYVTDVVDEKVSETKLSSARQPAPISLPVQRSGVYVVELEARDRLERAQVVSVDLYAGGDQPVAWAKPVSPVFSVAMDREEYNPGDTAALVLKSPFQQGDALVVVEAPDGNQYQWLSVKSGSAVFRFAIRNTYAPQVPVHFVLMRGRIAGVQPTAVDQTDIGKPTTMAATAWVKVNPVGNRIDVKLKYPEKARPHQKIEVKINLSTAAGHKPLPGEVTLWLVDQGVLALGKEQRLDPLPDFITIVHSYLSVHDTRNMAFGYLPFAESPGGDAAEDEGSILERATVRRLFKTVPYYNPAISIGPDGTALVSIELPDNLTNFKIRAKAISGPDRFGFATGQIAVRLPVLVQPGLPRFVRPGDSFAAVAVGRIVEGEAGPGAAEIKANGITVKGDTKREFTWVPNRAQRIEFPVDVPTPPYNKFGNLSYREVSLLMGVERLSDGARDAFEVKLPILDDRPKATQRLLLDLLPGKAVSLPAPQESARPGTVRRSVLVSGQPGLVRMAAGLDFLLEYPYGCTEQKLSRARAYIALRKFRDLLRQGGSDAEIERAVNDIMEWIPGVIDSNGLAAYWPGSPGYVSLTAWVVQFLVEAREAGFHVNEKVFNTLTASLERALRSDYSHFITGEALAERTWALSALADAGRFNSAYSAELARKSKYLDLEGVAQVLQSFNRSGDTSSATVRSLSQELWDGVVVRLYQDRELYGGLQERRNSCNGLILPSETRTLSEITRALSRVQPNNSRLPVLVNALVTLGRGDGWGSTNANSSALLALSQLLDPSFSGTAPHSIMLRMNGTTRDLSIGPNSPAGYFVTTSTDPADVILQPGGAGPVVLRADLSYVPAADGSRIAAKSQGFVVSREMIRVFGENEPADRMPVDQPGQTHDFSAGDVVEEHVQVVNPKNRNYVAVVVPLAAGMEPLNPALATAPPEATPNGHLTMTPTYVAYLDDHVAFYYDTLPKGTYDFYFRVRATIPGSFIQPAAHAEMMYDGAVYGNSAGARIKISGEN